jgi:hypothetical protein
MSDMMTIACVRFGALGDATKVRVKWLIEAGAWTDATIALLELALNGSFDALSRKTENGCVLSPSTWVSHWHAMRPRRLVTKAFRWQF